MTGAATPEQPRHGVGGWQLVEFDFDEETGVGRCWYHHPEHGPAVVDRDQYVSAEYHERVRDERRRAESRKLARPVVKS